MSNSNPAGTVWSDQEIDLAVASYFEMLRMEMQGKPYTKLHKNKEVQTHTGRSHKSVDFKYQNISAVLQHLAMDWIPGYKPKVNYQNALIAGVERYLIAHPDILMVQNTRITKPDLPSQGYLVPGPAPSKKPSEPKTLQRLARKFDPATRDARNRELGRLGEERILFSERARLIDAGKNDLARKVKWISEEEGDGAGYDILSFSESGDERLLEVKTTTGHQYTPFYLTENERQLSVERADEFRLVRLYNFTQVPKVFELEPPLENFVALQPTSYRASFEDNSQLPTTST